MGAKKCKVQWSRVACILQHRVRGFSLGACGDGARLSRAVPAIQFTSKKAYLDLHRPTFLGLFYNANKKARDPSALILPAYSYIAVAMLSASTEVGGR